MNLMLSGNFHSQRIINPSNLYTGSKSQKSLLINQRNILTKANIKISQIDNFALEINSSSSDLETRVKTTFFKVNVTEKLKFKPVKQKCEASTEIRKISNYKQIYDHLITQKCNKDFSEFLPIFVKKFKKEKKLYKGLILKEDLVYFDMVSNYHVQRNVFKSQEHVIDEKLYNYFDQQQKVIDLIFGFDTGVMKYLYMLKWQINIQNTAVVYVNEQFPVCELLKIIDWTLNSFK